MGGLEEKEGDNERVRSDFGLYKKEKAMEILALSNRLSNLKSQLEEVEKVSTKLEGQAVVVRESQANMMLQNTQMIMSVDNVFRRCEFLTPIEFEG